LSIFAGRAERDLSLIRTKAAIERDVTRGASVLASQEVHLPAARA